MKNEFSSLLQKAGMKLNRIVPTQSPMQIIEASLCNLKRTRFRSVRLT